MYLTRVINTIVDVLEAEHILADISEQTFRDIDAGEVQVGRELVNA